MAERQESPTWRAYVAFVDDIVYENLLLTVGVSMGYIADQMDPLNSNQPLFESRLELLDPNIVFVPSLDPKDPKGFNHLLADLIEDITKMSALVERLRTDLPTTYEQMIAGNRDMQAMKGEILDGVDKVVQEAAEFCNGFERYSYLWLEEREFSMEMFLKYGRLLEPDEIDLVMAKEANAPEPCEPTIEAFREQIDHYESLFQEIEGIESLQVFNSWFQVDVRPFRQAVMNIVRKWGNMFKNHLVDRVTSNLCDLGNFIRKADEGLLQTVVEGDYNGLVTIMAYLMNVKERALTTDEMFEPMQETIDLLKYYDMDIPEEVNVLLQELPEQWANTKKIAITVKQQVAPLQATEVVAIRTRIGTFDSRITFYREVFKSYNFFNYDCADPFRLLDGYSSDLQRLEGVMREIQSSGSLFEVNVPEFKLLKQCRKELKMLKVLLYVSLRKTKNVQLFTFPTATMGLHLPGAHQHRGLEADAVAQNRRREHGHRVQEVRQGRAIAGQGDATVGRVHDARGDGQEYADVVAGSRRTAELGDSGAALGAADGVDQGSAPRPSTWCCTIFEFWQH